MPTHSRLERLGFVPETGGRPCLWLHAASFGEVVTATPLIRALLDDFPAHALVVTTMTRTGAERVQAIFGDRVRHHFLPLDYPLATRRFVARLDPQLAIVAETELWPNLLAACRRRRVPVVIVNGRLGASTYRFYRRFAALSRGMLTSIAWIGAKSPEDAERFTALGASAGRVTVTGALKFDLALDEGLADASETLRLSWGKRFVWIAGSTHAGEDEQVLAAHAQLRHHDPTALLILVPRHPQRFEAVETLCRERGESVVRFSENPSVNSAATVLLGDTMGDLMRLYGCADVAFVGGSLVPIGGHNLLEPAALGVPVVSGPHLESLREIAESLAEHQARLEVADADALAQVLIALHDDNERRLGLGAAGRAVVAANRGALARTRERIARVMHQK
ncbi:3-deoxy-D-manno-octulosonic acid transferase [Salinicola rhizosphaerae]|uniref:3-deoxy-D-manno-octulosonic acid transferase n=1 Tax=Salinicola rhizosphaerae TaxID=1443141 RepID=A0ABQ3DSJ5_9GAMM|nr:3-deoxy-D-manno-octulosonic acid transferase [Salinicola rhizosphaerae]